MLYRFSVFVVVIAIVGIVFGFGASVVAAPAPENTDNAVESKNDEPKPEPVTFKAVITQYSRADSCHTVRNGKCIMASGKAVYVGAAACPRSLPFGTKVNVDGQTYTCEDRYATWLDRARGLPTIDIFVNQNPRGNSVGIVEIVD